MQLSLSFALELALALSIKRYTFPNDYSRSLKVNTAVELLVQEIFQLCSAGLRRIGDQVSVDPEDPANYDLFAGLEITFKRIGSLITEHLSNIFSLIWP